MIISLGTLAPARGARKRPKIVGRGPGSGHGKTSTRGGKGQTARTGGSIPPGFEGGQTPLIRRSPKRGFGRGGFRIPYETVNIKDLRRLPMGEISEMTPEVLHSHGLVKRAKRPVKLLGEGAPEARLRGVTIKVHAVSASARKKIEAAGGTVLILPFPH